MRILNLVANSPNITNHVKCMALCGKQESPVRWPVPSVSRLFLSYFSVTSQLFLRNFPLISHFSFISHLFLIYFFIISCFSFISHLFLNNFPIISRLFPISQLFHKDFLFISQLMHVTHEDANF